MKHIVLSILAGTSLALVACSEPKPLSKEEQWQGYCKSFGHAARAIFHDRQNGITEAEAREHASKVEDPIIKAMLSEQIDLAYAQAKVAGKFAQQELMEPFMQAAEQKCLATPYTDIPKFKPL